MPARSPQGRRSETASELEAARLRIAELEAREADPARSAKVQAALYRIAETASAARDMPEFYAAIHKIVGELMYADNFYIALYDDERRLINYPFYVDDVETDLPDPNAWDPIGIDEGAGTTAYLLRTGLPLRLDTDSQRELYERGDAVLIGAPSEDWVGAPLVASGRTIGAVVTQSYRPDRTHGPEDLELLTFVATHVATALTRARAIEETRQRNAELAVVNEIGAALAKQLDFEAIVEVVGERVGQIFDATSLFVALYDEATNVIRFPYEIAEGDRLHSEPIQLGQGLTSKVIASRAPLRLGRLDDTAASDAIVVAGPASESWLGVPILAGERVIGIIGLENLKPNAYSESDERLLSTVASSMGVALENARLFDETKRLLGEADERAAELVVVNSVQQGLAQNLDMQAMYELVGDKIREIFDAQVVDIGIFDFDAGLVRYPYAIERGVRFPRPSRPRWRAPGSPPS